MTKNYFFYDAGMRQGQKGLSLIEFMVSITIGLILLASLSGMLVNQNRARAEIDRANRLVENGRYAMEVLTESVHLAGFYGELDPTSLAVSGAAVNPCDITPSAIAGALRLHLQGYNNVTTATKPTCVPAVVEGTDIVVVRRVETNTSAAPTSGTMVPYLQASLCQYDTDIFKLSTTADFTLHKKDCTSGGGGSIADVRHFLIQIYFIAPENTTGDGKPTLKRVEISSTGALTTTALVESIENMQIDYGLDTNGDGAIDSYSDCATCTNADWANAVGIRIHLLARNPEATPYFTDTKTYTLGTGGSVGPFNDTYKRRVYSQFVRAVNPASRRETP